MSTAIKTVKNTVKLPNYILKTTLPQPHKRNHDQNVLPNLPLFVLFRYT